MDSAIESIQSDTSQQKIEEEPHRSDQNESQDPETETENEDFQDAPEVDLNNLSLKENHVSQIESSTSQPQNTQVQINENDDDEEEEIDSEDDEINGGEWITSENLSQHQARSLGLVPAEESSPQEIVGGNPSSSNPHKGSTSNDTTSVQDEIEEGWEVPKSKKSSKFNNNKTQSQSQVNQTFGAPTTISNGGGGGKSKKKGNKSSKTDIATLTADYAVQNVLLQMGLGLVGAGGMRIKSVRSWVLRCHGCYK